MPFKMAYPKNAALAPSMDIFCTRALSMNTSASSPMVSRK
jgi:hypothetical protein